MQSFLSHVNVAALTPACAAGIALLCCVLGVFGAQFAAKEWRTSERSAPQPGDSDLVVVHAEAARRRARAKAEAFQFASTVLLAVTAAVALYAIVPGLPTEGIGALALAGAIYVLGDALLSARAELRSIGDDELFGDFKVRARAVDPQAVMAEFSLERPDSARRLERRKVTTSER